MQRLVSLVVIALAMCSGALFGTGCTASSTYLRPGASDAPFRFRVEGATEAQREIIAQAAWRCNAVTNEAHQITLADDAERAVFVVDRADIPCAVPPPGVVDGCAVDGTDAYVNRGLSDRALEVVTAHEFMHLLGLNHVAPDAGVMSPSAEPFPFTEADLAECRRVHACD